MDIREYLLPFSHKQILFMIVYGVFVYHSEQFMSMINLQTIGRNIAKLRDDKGMSQEDLAGESEINRGYISRIENGHVSFSVPILLRIAQALGVDPKELVEE